ncbi:DUF1206 domain-containing protein [Pseudactinotalea sp. Z1739]|uniref:DUF1206 domain-containing protein n=1 Tax=Pseudactinotalea sp. Z1739 TaxID=3413028 RepID=UPI003C7D8F06
MSTTHRSAESSARRVRTSPTMKVVARIGYAATGLLHLVLGWIVIRMGTADSSGEDADQSGALTEIASQPFGRLALAVVAAGLAALVIWRVLTIVRGGPARERLKAAGKAAVHLVLAVLAARYAVGLGEGGQDEEGLTRQVMSYPAGRIAIAAVGAGLLIAGIVHVYIGWTKRFQQDLRASRRPEISRAVRSLGRAGYWAKGAALAVLGVLFGIAAWTADPEEAGGLDEAFAAIGAQPYGSVLLIITGVGLVCYGLFCFAQSRYVRL